MWQAAFGNKNNCMLMMALDISGSLEIVNKKEEGERIISTLNK